MFMWTVAELSRLFTSSRSEEAAYAANTDCDELADLLNSGALLIRKETYTQTPEPRRTLPPTLERQAFEQACSPPGNRAHSLLRWWAWNWLRRMGETRPLYDFHIGNGAVDVAAVSLGIAAECGDTDPRRCARILKEPDWKTLAIFPYPRRVTVLALSPSRPCEKILEYEVFLLTFANAHSGMRF